MKFGNKICMTFGCDDYIYVNILTCYVSRNLDQGAQYFSNSLNRQFFVQNVLFNLYFIFFNI